MSANDWCARAFWFEFATIGLLIVATIGLLIVDDWIVDCCGGLRNVACAQVGDGLCAHTRAAAVHAHTCSEYTEKGFHIRRLTVP